MNETVTITVSQEQMPLDLVLFRHFKKEIPGLVERVHEMNPGLAAKGVFLPVGEKIRVEIPTPAERQLVRVTRLY